MIHFVGGKDAAVNALQKKLAEVDAKCKKEIEAREAVEAELKTLQDKVCINLQICLQLQRFAVNIISEFQS